MSHAERGQKGGKARIAKLSAKERSALARKAGLANADRLARLRALEDDFKAETLCGHGRRWEKCDWCQKLGTPRPANSAKQGGDAQ